MTKFSVSGMVAMVVLGATFQQMNTTAAQATTYHESEAQATSKLTVRRERDLAVVVAPTALLEVEDPAGGLSHLPPIVLDTLKELERRDETNCHTTASLLWNALSGTVPTKSASHMPDREH